MNFNNKVKKVLFVIPTLNQGGAERVVSVLANQFSSDPNLDVSIALLAKSKDFYSINKNVTIHRLEYEGGSRVAKLLSMIKVVLSLRKILIKERPTAIVSFMDKYNVCTLLANSFLGLKVYVSDRSSPLKPKSFILRTAKRLTYKKSQGVIAQTEQAKQVLEGEIDGLRIRVIPNPVKDLSKSSYIVREPIVINVGRLVPEKGQSNLIEAFSRINAKGWTLVILGDGPLRNELTSQIESKGLEDKVLLVGAVSNIDEWLHRSSIFVLSSKSEGFPNSLLEAMSAGLACISFDCDSGPRDIIEHGVNGMLIEKENVNALSTSLESLISNEELRLIYSRNAEKSSKNYDVREISDQFKKFILE